MAKIQQKKGLMAGLVVLIVACVGWTVYVVATSGERTIVIPDTKTDAERFRDAIVALNAERKFQFVDCFLSEDKTSATVGGSVATAADLEELKAKLAQIEPKVSYTVKVKIGLGG